MLEIVVENIPKGLQIIALAHQHALSESFAYAAATRLDEPQPMVGDEGRRDMARHELRATNIGQRI